MALVLYSSLYALCNLFTVSSHLQMAVSKSFLVSFSDSSRAKHRFFNYRLIYIIVITKLAK